MDANSCPKTVLKNMSEPKKNPLGALVFCIFVFVLPLMTVYFSKSGLDKHKDLKGEMTFFEDSIRVNMDGLPVHWNAALSNEFVKGKLVLVNFWDGACDEKIDEVVSALKKMHSQLNKEDQHKILFVMQTEDHSQDSLWALNDYVKKWEVDTTNWKFVQQVDKKAYQLAPTSNCFTTVMLDGRVARKDDSGDYKRGPLMCHHYAINDAKDVEAMLKHMAVIMPSKKRKSIEYKADEKLY